MKCSLTKSFLLIVLFLCGFVFQGIFSSSLSFTCPDGTIQCSDGSCVKDKADCSQTFKCPEESPILCADGNCVVNKGDCKSQVEVKCSGESPVLCPNGSCVTDPSLCSDIKKNKGDVTVKDLVKAALKDVNLARRNLSRSSKVARPISKKILKLIREIKDILQNGEEGCEDDANSALDDLLIQVNEVNGNVCEGTQTKDCIPQDAADQFSEAINDASSIILSGFNFDDDEDFIPDICQ